MNIRNKQFPNSLDMCSQRPGVYIQTPTHQKLLQTQPSLCVSTVYTGCLLLILSSVVWVLISAAACRRVSLIVTLLLQISDSPPSFCFCVFQSRCCQSLFLVWLYLHASPCDLECVSHKGGGDGEQLSWGCTVVFCKCKQLILSLPAGCSAQLSVNRREIMFIRAHNRCIPLTDSTPPSNQLLLIHFSRSPTFPSAQPLSALSPETGCSLWSNKTETLCRSYLSDPCSPGRRLHI